jgi:hypothetical protein
MKRALLLLAAVLVFQGTAPAQGTVSFGVFYNSLDPYGEWIPLEGGVYGWRPLHMAVDWRPYIMGQWVWTVDGWYWLSEEPWGWATYHYGRWYYDDYYGWIWIPGYDWAPAWVEWRYGDDYVGWAPLGPYAIWDFHYGVRYRHHWVTPWHWWAFVDCRHVGSPALHRYVYRNADNRRYIGNTREAGNVRYRNGRIESRGPDRSFVERKGRVRIEAAQIVDTGERSERVTRQGGRERIEVYRPRIQDRPAEMIEKPSRLQQGGKRIDLRAEETDVRVRSAERTTGGDTERGELRERPRSDTPRRMAPDTRTVEPQRIPDDRTIDRRAPDPGRIERAEPRRVPQERTIERKSSGIEQQQPHRQNDVRPAQRPSSERPARIERTEQPPRQEPRKAPAARPERTKPEPKRDRR